MGELILAATPMGNIGDASARLREAISGAGAVVAEDTRRFQRLCKDLGLQTDARIISFFEGNEVEKLKEIQRALNEYDSVLLITDAGMPTISDPGFRAVRMAIDHGFKVRALPGPSAVITALAISGLPTDRFTFEGFGPRTSQGREKYFEELALERRTMVFFESPHRIVDFIEDALKVFGTERKIAICRELTKVYEEIYRGTLESARNWALSKEMLGEFTIVLAGYDPALSIHDDESIAATVLRYESAGMTRKEAISLTAKELSLPKRRIFDIMVERK